MNSSMEKLFLLQNSILGKSMIQRYFQLIINKDICQIHRLSEILPLLYLSCNTLLEVMFSRRKRIEETF